MLPYLAPILVALALCALVAYLDARAARRPLDRAINELVAEECRRWHSDPTVVRMLGGITIPQALAHLERFEHARRQRKLEADRRPKTAPRGYRDSAMWSGRNRREG